MLCPSCHAENDDASEACFTCGRSLYALTQGILVAQRYEILSPLGSGGMGRVYKAHDRTLDEYVAIKVLRSELTREPEIGRRFRSEIKLARKVSHRNVCRIHEYGEDGGLAFICMEFIDGKNVREFLSERSLSPEEGLELSIQVAEGLQAVHEHGIVHRDFKASNIMIDRKGVVKLMDFGIAKQAASETTGLTGSGVIGTPEYMSPEQASGSKVDLRSDLYSLGCVIYEAFTGAPPFRGATPLETMRLHEHEPPQLDSPAIPEPVRAILRRALAKDPAARYANAADLVDALRQARAQLGLSARGSRLSLDSTPFAPPRPSPPTRTVAERSGSSGRRSRRTLAGGVLAGALALAAGVLAFRVWLPTEEPLTPSTTSPAPSTTVPAFEPTAEPTRRSAPVRDPMPQPSAHAAPPATAPARPARAEPQPSPTVSPPTATTPPRPAAASSPPRVPSPQGTLSLFVVPEAEVTIDGQSIGAVSKREIPLSVGPHTVRVLHPHYQPLQRKVSILPGAATSLVLDLSEKGIRKQP